MNNYLLLFCAAVLLSSCVHATEKMPPAPQAELLDFAQANCLFWYFSKKGYALDDIRAISGGMVERGTASAEQYEQVSLLVKRYSPQLKTKQALDIDLLKCFTMEHDADFLRSLAEAQ